MSRLDFLTKLETIIEDRLSNPVTGSYTVELAAGGPRKVAQKLGEEAVEVVIAAVAEDDARLTAEAADLLYHLLVLLRVRGLSLADAVAELERRHSA